MALDAGSVYVELGFKLDASDAAKYERETKKAAANMEVAERKIDAANKKAAASTAAASKVQQQAHEKTARAAQQSAAVTAAAQDRVGASVKRSADLYQDAQGRWRAASGRFASDAEKAAAAVETSNDRQSRSFKKTEQNMSSYGRMMRDVRDMGMKATRTGGLVLGAAAVGGVVLFARQVVKAVQVAGDFDQELRRLGARSDVTDKQLRRIRKTALDLGTDMGVGARQAAKASTELVKGGLSVQKLLAGGLKGALALSVAGEMDMAEAAETVANALNAFKLKGSEAEHVADALATAANATTADVADMAIALTQGGSAAKAAGLSFDETVAALESLALIGVKGSDAGTSLKSMLTQIASPTKKASELMDDLGLKFFDANGEMKPLTQVAGMLRDKMKGLTAEQRLQAVTTLAGTDGMRALLALYDAGPDKIKSLQKGLKEQGTAAEVAAKQNEGMVGAQRRLSASWERAQILFGEELLPGVAEGAESLTDKLNEMAEDGSLKRMGEDMGDFVSSAVNELPAATDKLEEFADMLSTGFKDVGDTLGTIKDVVKVAQGMGELMSMGWILDAITDPVDTALAMAEKMLTAFKLVAQAADAAIPGDQSGPVKAIEGAIENLKSLRKEMDNQDLKIKFTADQASLDEVYETAGRLEDMGKRDVAIRITANSSSAEEAVAGMKAVIDGVPERRVLNIIARSQSAEESVAAFNALADGVPPQRVTTIQAKAKTAQGAVLAFTAIAMGVPASKVTKVLAETNSARGQINGIIGLINAVPASKTTTVTIRRLEQTVQQIIKDPGSHQIKKRAQGRPAGGTETALIGEGAGPEWRVNPDTGLVYKTAGPQLVDLGDRDYVIPTEDRYRGRALGLLSMLAADMGVPGFKKGKEPKKATGKKKQRFVPPKLEPQAYSVDQFETRETSAESAWKKAGQLHKNLATAKAGLRDTERRNPKTAAQKQNKVDDLRRARAKVHGIEKDIKALPENGNTGRLRAILTQRRKELAQAKRFQADIRKQEELADIARDQMQLADRRDDQGGYDRAQSDRSGALGKLKQLLTSALGFATKAGNDDFVRALQQQLGQVDLSLDENTEAMGVDETPAQAAQREAAERLADTGMTDAERVELQGIDKDLALAALTQTLDDDAAAAGRKVSFLESILSAALVDPARGGAPAITELAGELKQARENVASFTGGSVNDNQDLQAQLEQERERTRVATETGRIDSQALAAFQGWAAPGGPGAGTVINVNTHVNTLHPGDPAVWSALAQASNMGNDLGTIRGAATLKVGP